MESWSMNEVPCGELHSIGPARAVTCTLEEPCDSCTYKLADLGRRYLALKLAIRNWPSTRESDWAKLKEIQEIFSTHGIYPD